MGSWKAKRANCANGRQIPWGYSLAWKAKQLMYKYASADFLTSIGVIEQGAT